MPLRSERFNHLSRADAVALLNRLEGPLLEIILSGDSSDVSSLDVVPEVLLHLSADQSAQVIFPTAQEQDEWERFKLEHGEGPKQIGEFIYGSLSNPWS